jgi:hypothetical protein
MIFVLKMPLGADVFNEPEVARSEAILTMIWLRSLVVQASNATCFMRIELSRSVYETTSQSFSLYNFGRNS